MSKIEVSHIPTVTRYYINGAHLSLLLHNMLPWYRFKMTDNHYYYVNWEDWGKIFDYVQRSLPYYVRDTFDCENFADYVRIQTAIKFGINTCASVEGWAILAGYNERQRHGWNVFFDGENFYQLESQICMDIKEIDDSDYVPDEIVIG